MKNFLAVIKDFFLFMASMWLWGVERIFEILKEVGLLLLTCIPIAIYIALWWLLEPSGFWQRLAMVMVVFPFVVVEIVWLLFLAKILRW